MRKMRLRIGFVPLIDAAPLIAAVELGFFREESLEVSLHRQVGWANLRDKLTFGQLDAGHALLGMPLSSYLGRDSFVEPLIALMSLGAGGNAITVHKELADLGVGSASSLAATIKAHSRFRRPVIGHVFQSSMHHYLLREWLASAGIDPDHDVQLCVIPPPQMPEHMKGGYVDLFCVGEPWNTLATRQGVGVSIMATTDILPNHPEKVLAVTRRFALAEPEVLTPMIRAILRGCIWCDAKENQSRLAMVLAGEDYLDQPTDVIEESLAIDREFGANAHQRSARPRTWQLRSFSPAATFPNKMYFAWLMRQMIRWNHLHPEADIPVIADACVNPAPYRAAARDLNLPCPDQDFVPMELRHNRLFTLKDATLLAPIAKGA